ncbi:MAG: hypothetical protein M1818_006418 [Claussenomyces sp. TS43310]|nr:MAG: hypothetical protein M1818_006418 [Claussenomyces sp. TS43310]
MSKVWNCEPELSLRRFNPRGNPYQISHDRYTTHANGHRDSPRSYGLPSHDSSHNDHDPEQDSGKNPRRRIPVACVRCRKRKIKCSGPQNDLGCTNCKNAGVDNCQFNRVTSEPVQWRESSATVDFNYDIGVASNIQCRNPPPNSLYGTSLSSYSASNPVPLNLYRSHGIPGYQYSGKPNSYASNYGADYGDEAVDYSLSGGPYPLLSHDHVTPAAYSSNGSSRVWTAPQKAGSALYFDSESANPGYHSQMSYPSHNYSLRPSISTEPNSFSFSGMASSLPTPPPITSNDRMLPMPASNRGSNLLPLSRTSDTMTYNTLPAQSTSKGGHTANAMYVPLSSSPETENVHSYTGNSRAELYGSSGGDDWQEGSAATLRSPPSSSDLYFPACPGDMRSSRKESQGGQSNSSAGLLSNGHPYVLPYEGTTAPLSRHPSLDLTHVATHRPSSASLHA